jgi:hypothetical protein
MLVFSGAPGAGSISGAFDSGVLLVSRKDGRGWTSRRRRKLKADDMVNGFGEMDARLSY